MVVIIIECNSLRIYDIKVVNLLKSEDILLLRIIGGNGGRRAQDFNGWFSLEGRGWSRTVGFLIFIKDYFRSLENHAHPVPRPVENFELKELKRIRFVISFFNAPVRCLLCRALPFVFAD